jgi:hypothetical protein
MANLFNAGDKVLVCGQLARMPGEVLWLCSQACPEHGDQMYRVRFKWPAGEAAEGDFCERILAMPSEQ